ncbi:hypothetical protein BH23ACT8_BH23ACT8_18530 [soil metagenome]
MVLWIADAVVGAVAAVIADGDERHLQLVPERCRHTRAQLKSGARQRYGHGAEVTWGRLARMDIVGMVARRP